MSLISEDKIFRDDDGSFYYLDEKGKRYNIGKNFPEGSRLSYNLDTFVIPEEEEEVKRPDIFSHPRLPSSWMKNFEGDLPKSIVWKRSESKRDDIKKDLEKRNNDYKKWITNRLISSRPDIEIIYDDDEKDYASEDFEFTIPL